MPLSPDQENDLAAMPPVLRALLEAELAAGNGVAEVGHTFPAPPAGAFVLLTQPLKSRPQESGDGIVYYNRRMPTYSGEITDAKRHFFLLEPPLPPEPEPDMDAIRAALSPGQSEAPQEPAPADPSTPRSHPTDRDPVTEPRSASFGTVSPARERFERSLIIDYDKWHDGIGYDVEAIKEMSPAEAKSVESTLISRGLRDWRDVEAVAAFDTPTARAALRQAMRHPDPVIRHAVHRYAPELVPEEVRIKSLVDALSTAVSFGGLGETLDQVAEFHPPPVLDALFRATLERTGDVAVHYSALLCFIHGKAPVPFDWAQRPFFLRFHTENRSEREAVFRELCEKIKVDPTPYLRKSRKR